LIIGDAVVDLKNGDRGDGIWLYDPAVGEVVQKATAAEVAELKGPSGSIKRSDIDENYQEDNQYWDNHHSNSPYSGFSGGRYYETSGSNNDDVSDASSSNGDNTSSDNGYQGR